MLLPVFTGSRPISQPQRGYSVVQRGLRRLQPLREVIQQLLRGELMGVDLLQTFFHRRIQPFHQRQMIMWVYPGPSCPDLPFSVELGDTEINTLVPGVLIHEDDLNFGSSPVHLREVVDNPWVSPLVLTFVYLCQFLFLNTRAFLCMILGTHAIPLGGHLT
jgi:hypothetical protein